MDREGFTQKFLFAIIDKMLFRWFALVAIMVAVTENEGANILGLFTVPSKSHSILAYELFKELVKAGHQVMK